VLYRIVNPSDLYTIECPDLEIAALACVLLGQGQYAFEPIDARNAKLVQPAVPLFLFGDAGPWFQENFNVDAQGLYRRVKDDPGRCAQLADALDGVLIGDAQDRELFAVACSFMPDSEKRERFRTIWHDKKRSSMNDIGTRAREIAKRLRDGAAQPVIPAPRQVFTT
jgi:hypothetical protein